MAESGTDKPKRSMKPKQGVIDLEAEEIERGPVEGEAPEPEAPEIADPLADDPAPEADDPNLFEAEPRSRLLTMAGAGLAGAAISTVAILALLASGAVPITPAPDPVLGDRVLAVEAELQELASAPKQPPQPAVDLGPLRAEIEALSKQVADLRNAPPAAAPAAPDPRVDELAARMDTLSQSAAGRVDEAAFQQLAARVDELAAKASEPPAPDPSVQQALAGAKSATALAAVSSLESAVSRGVPYASALGAVRTQMPDVDLGALEPGAENGLPPVALLAGQLSGALENAPAPPSTATGIMDRLAEGARGLVRIRPVDGSVPEIDAGDPWSARSAVLARLGQGDYAGALADWEKLDAAAKTASEGAKAALQARLDANAALDALRAQALGLASEARP